MRNIRVELLRQLDEIDGAAALWSFQRRLTDEIISAEPRAFADRRSPERDHLRLLRLFGDALAWRLLHPHTIRQLGKNSGKPPALYNQKGLPRTLELAESICTAGEPALVADLTFCLRVSDVIVCTDPECPRLIESGGHPAYINRGRKGRQKRRADAITQLLRDGEATLFGDEATSVTIEIRGQLKTSHAAIGEAISLWSEGQPGVVEHGPADLIVAVSGDGDEDLPTQAHVALDAMRERSEGQGHLGIGVHLRLLERPDSLLPPPHVWPLDRLQREALIEGDVAIIHLVDLHAFVGEGSRGLGRVSEITTNGEEVVGFVVEAAGNPVHLSPRHLNDVLYAFQTIESARDSMVEAAVASLAQIADEDLTAPGSVVHLENIEEIQEAMREQEAGRGPTLVTVPVTLASKLGVRGGS